MASKISTKHHVCSNRNKYTVSGNASNHVRYTHGAQFMLIGQGTMTSLAVGPAGVLMTARHASAKDKRRSQMGGLVARGPEYNNGK